MPRKEIYHAMIVHFPVALLMASYAFYVAWRVTKNGQLALAGKWALIAGACGAIAAAVSGFVAEGAAAHTEAAHKILESTHQPFGTVVMAAAVGLALWGFLSKWDFPGLSSTFFIIAFTALVSLLIVVGHSGAMMVYEHGMSVSRTGACSSPAHHYDDDGTGQAPKEHNTKDATTPPDPSDHSTHEEHQGHEAHSH